MPTARQTVKVSSLDAARALFFIIAGLAIRQALIFFAHPDATDPAAAIPFPWRLIIALAYLFTVFRFSHGIAVVYELEKHSAQTSTSPSSKTVELVFLLFMLEAIALFIMSLKLADPRGFVWAVIVLLAADLLYIGVSQTVRDAGVRKVWQPLYLLRRRRQTRPGTAAQAHLQWALSDLALIVALVLTLLPRTQILDQLSFGNQTLDWLLTVALFLYASGATDYWMNREFYFGASSRSRKKCVFVSSPVSASTATEVAKNIRRAQWYCRQLFTDGKVIPFAAHAFYSYFLSENCPRHKKLARRAALTFLSQCDAIYLYVPDPQIPVAKLADTLPHTMREEYEQAQEFGLEICILPTAEPPNEFVPTWREVDYSSAPQDADLPKDVVLDKPLKRAFVCSPLRISFAQSDASTVDEQHTRLASNIRTAQWLCYQLMVKDSEDSGRAAFAPHAFYPYFADQPAAWGSAMLESTMDIVKTCETMYVFTQDGLENDQYISEGMRESISNARDLGLEVVFRQLPMAPPDEWKPAPWRPAIEPTRAPGVSPA